MSNALARPQRGLEPEVGGWPLQIGEDAFEFPPRELRWPARPFSFPKGFPAPSTVCDQPPGNRIRMNPKETCYVFYLLASFAELDRSEAVMLEDFMGQLLSYVPFFTHVLKIY